MKGAVRALAGAAGAAALGWAALVRIQGDPEVAFEADGIRWQFSDPQTARSEIRLVNRGKDGAVIHRVVGHVVEGPAGRVIVNRQGKRAHEDGWWVSNVLKPGESCVAEVTVALDEPASGPVVIELDAHELGRRPKVHRTLRVPVPLGV